MFAVHYDRLNTRHFQSGFERREQLIFLMRFFRSHVLTFRVHDKRSITVAQGRHSFGIVKFPEFSEFSEKIKTVHTLNVNFVHYTYFEKQQK